MRLKVGVVVIVALLLAVSSAMATSISLKDTSADNFVQLIAGKSTTYGVSVNGAAVSNPGNGGNGSFAEGQLDVQPRTRGNLDPTFNFLIQGNRRLQGTAVPGWQFDHHPGSLFEGERPFGGCADTRARDDFSPGEHHGRWPWFSAQESAEVTCAWCRNSPSTPG
jgi:uncharacterized membrane protein